MRRPVSQPFVAILQGTAQRLDIDLRVGGRGQGLGAGKTRSQKNA
jgi:hypothetical protein